VIVIGALVSGLLFGLGLMVSGMVNPVKILGFLDLAGRWDPSLAFAMVGAGVISAIGFFVAKRRKVSFLGISIQLPTNAFITPRLVLGSAAFGVGWGLAGFCPGPALVALGAGYPKAVGFCVAMLAGMAAFELIERAKLARSA
jgi:uncharacterized protein